MFVIQYHLIGTFCTICHTSINCFLSASICLLRVFAHMFSCFYRDVAAWELNSLVSWTWTCYKSLTGLKMEMGRTCLRLAKMPRLPSTFLEILPGALNSAASTSCWRSSQENSHELRPKILQRPLTKGSLGLWDYLRRTKLADRSLRFKKRNMMTCFSKVLEVLEETNLSGGWTRSMCKPRGATWPFGIFAASLLQRFLPKTLSKTPSRRTTLHLETGAQGFPCSLDLHELRKTRCDLT